LNYLPVPDRRTLIVAAHPDDEVIGLGAVLNRFRELAIVHVTDGSPMDTRDASANGFKSREAYADERRKELEHALHAGEIRAKLHSLEIIDQRASFELPRVIDGIARIVREYRPEVIWTHAYEGGHPDHDACAFAVHAGCEGVAIAEFTSYHAGPRGIVTCEFLPSAQPVVTHELTDEERARKARMLACFTTQRETLSQFGLDVERYRWSPGYDFTRPPHEGRLYYENFPWGINGAEFVALACGVEARSR
jgi:LmbE family N-acetylglucosaminyl deacetylase